MEELRVLAFTIEIDYDNIHGEIKDVKIIELIKFCKRKNILDVLISQINIDTNNALYTNDYLK